MQFTPLEVLPLHFDSGMVTPMAERNIKLLIQRNHRYQIKNIVIMLKLDVNHIVKNISAQYFLRGHFTIFPGRNCLHSGIITTFFIKRLTKNNK